MMKFLRKNMQTVFMITIIGFIAGIFIGFGGYFSNRTISDGVANVNGEKISFKKYRSLFNRIMDNKRETTEEITEQMIEQIKQEVIQDLVQEEVFYQEAKKYGIVVTDKEVAYDISRWPAFNNNGRFDQGLYFRILGMRLHMTPAEFEESRKRQIAIAKLRSLIQSGVKITQPELQLEYIKKNGSLKNFDKEKNKLYEELLKQKTIDTFNEWYKILGSSIKVKVHTELLKQI